MLGGRVQWVQLVLESNSSVGGSEIPGLDKTYPYDYGIVVEDSPADVGIFEEVRSDTRTFKGEMYLMWQAPLGISGSSFVPLYKINWGFSAKAGYSGLIWQLSELPHYDPVQPVQTNDPPKWTQRAHLPGLPG